MGAGLPRYLVVIAGMIATLAGGCGGGSSGAGGRDAPAVDVSSADGARDDAAVPDEARQDPDAAAAGETDGFGAADDGAPSAADAATDADTHLDLGNGRSDGDAEPRDTAPDMGVADVSAEAPVEVNSDDEVGTAEGIPTRACTVMGLGAVQSIAYLSDGSGFVVGTAASIAKVFRSSDGAEVRTFIGHEAAVNAVAVSGDGTLLATASADKTARLWRIGDGALLATLVGHTTPLFSVAVSPDGTTVATGSAEGEVRLWAASDGAPRRTVQAHVDQVTGLAFVTNDVVASAGREGEIELWSAADGALIRSLYTGTSVVGGLTLSRDRSMLAAAAGASIRVWRVATGEVIKVFTAQFSVQRLAFAPDGTRLFGIVAGSRLEMFPLDGVPLSLASFLWTSQGLAVSPDGGTILVGNSFGELLQRDAAGAAKGEIVPGLVQVRDLTFTADGTQLLIGGEGGLRPGLQLRRVSDGALVRTMGSDISTSNAVAVARDGAMIASAEEDGRVLLWSPATAAMPRELVRFSVRGEGVAFLPGNEWLVAVGSDDSARMIRTATGESAFGLVGVNGYVESLVVSNDGTLIAAGGGLQRVGIWRASDRTRLQLLESAHGTVARGLAFSRDGTTLASTGDERVRLWSVATGAAVAQLNGMTRSGESVDFSADGAFVAAGGFDRVVHLWRVADRQLVASLRGHTERVTTVVFSPDGRRLATGSFDGTVRIWCRR